MWSLHRKKKKVQNAADRFVFDIKNLQRVRDGKAKITTFKEKIRIRVSKVLPFLKKEEEKGDGIYDRIFTRGTRPNVLLMLMLNVLFILLFGIFLLSLLATKYADRPEFIGTLIGIVLHSFLIFMLIFPKFMFYFVIAVQQMLSTRSSRLITLIIFILSFEGPAMNILTNMKETASGVACVQVNVLAAKRDISNTGKGFAQKFLLKIQKVLLAMAKPVDKVKFYLHAIDNYMMKFVNIVKKTYKVSSNLTGECKQLLKGPYKLCRDIFAEGYSLCMDKARYFSVAGACSNVRSIEKICDVAKGYVETVCSIPTMVKDGIKGSVVPMYETTFINALNLVRLAYSVPRKIANRGYGTAKETYIELNNAAHMKIEFKKDQDDVDDDAVQGLRERIERSFASILSVYQQLLIWISRIIQWLFIPITILFPFLTSLRFIYKYNYYDEYHNDYLTNEFDKINFDVVLKGQQAALPLEEQEAAMYIRRTAWKMNASEQATFYFYLFFTLLSYTTPFFLFSLDFTVYKTLEGAYFILNLTNVEVPAHYEMKVAGNTTMSEMMFQLSDSFSPLVQSVRQRDSNWRRCFSPPSPPDYFLFCIVIAAFITCIILSRVQVWLDRQALATADYFFPERVRIRALFLYSKILEDRRNLLTEMLKIAHMTGGDENVMRRAIQSRGYHKVDCCRCEAADMSLRDESNVRICSGCGAFYCVNCFCTTGNCKRCGCFMQRLGNLNLYYEELDNVDVDSSSSSSSSSDDSEEEEVQG